MEQRLMDPTVPDENSTRGRNFRQGMQARRNILLCVLHFVVKTSAADIFNTIQHCIIHYQDHQNVSLITPGTEQSTTSNV